MPFFKVKFLTVFQLLLFDCRADFPWWGYFILRYQETELYYCSTATTGLHNEFLLVRVLQQYTVQLAAYFLLLFPLSFFLCCTYRFQKLFMARGVTSPFFSTQNQCCGSDFMFFSSKEFLQKLSYF